MLHYRYLDIFSPRQPISVEAGTTGEGFSPSPTTATLNPGYFDLVVNQPDRRDIQIHITCARVQ